MNVLIVGGGGREHAIAWALSKSEQVEQLYCAPGNGGIAALAQCVPLSATDVDGVVAWAQTHSIDFVDRKSTRLNSSHITISYAVFCLKQKTKKKKDK